MAPVASYPDAQLNVAYLIALLVALILTTVGSLLSAIGFAVIDRTMRFNVLAMSGNAVESARDSRLPCCWIKTGTLTVGNRQAPEILLAGVAPALCGIFAAKFAASRWRCTSTGWVRI